LPLPPPLPPAPPPSPSWRLSQRGTSCNTECASAGLVCNIGPILALAGDTAATLAAITAAGGTCTSVTGWAYPSGPGICTNSGCCGGSCVGICVNGVAADTSCSTSNSAYDRLCACAPPPSPQPPSPPPVSPSPWLPPLPPPSVAFEFAGTSTSFHYASALWTDSALHSSNDTSWARTERKTPFAFAVTTLVTLEMEHRNGTVTSVDLPISPPTSLQAIFNGGYVSTNGSLGEWRALSGYGYQSMGCNRQGFNVATDGALANHGVDGQLNARIGVYFNNENHCTSCDSGRIVGGSSASAGTGCWHGCTGQTTWNMQSDMWVRILASADVLSPSPPPPSPSVPGPPSLPLTTLPNTLTSALANRVSNDQSSFINPVLICVLSAFLICLFIIAFVILQRRRRGVEPQGEDASVGTDKPTQEDKPMKEPNQQPSPPLQLPPTAPASALPLPPPVAPTMMPRPAPVAPTSVPPPVPVAPTSMPPPVPVAPTSMRPPAPGAPMSTFPPTAAAPVSGELSAKLPTAFQRADMNKDGILSRQEFSTFLKVAPPPPARPPPAMPPAASTTLPPMPQTVQARMPPLAPAMAATMPGTRPLPPPRPPPSSLPSCAQTPSHVNLSVRTPEGGPGRVAPM